MKLYMDMIVNRDLYLNRLIVRRNNGQIKDIAGKCTKDKDIGQIQKDMNAHRTFPVPQKRQTGIEFGP